MVGTNTSIMKEKAPCGRRVTGVRYQEDDGSGMICNDVTYACGCRSISHVFHDGSWRTRTTRHDGRVLVNELSAEHAE